MVIGLLLVPNGKLIGKQLGDRYPGEERLEEEMKGPGGRLTALVAESNSTIIQEELHGEHASHPWGVFFTVLGTVLLDFDADACQSPSRAYLLDVTLPGTSIWLHANSFPFFYGFSYMSLCKAKILGIRRTIICH